MTERGFRAGDKITVHGLTIQDQPTALGRVVCINRKSKYGMSVVVLYDVGSVELIETFGPDGKRYLKEDGRHITLGHKP